jgi:hypothetical protein
MIRVILQQFDEVRLRKSLDALPLSAQSAFAQACALRTLAIDPVEYQPLGVPAKLSDGARALCERAIGVAGTLRDTSGNQQTLARALLVDFENSTELDDDRVAAWAFVLRHLLSGDAQEAVWTARRAYEARDVSARQRILAGDSARPEAHLVALLADSGVQTELAKQANDLVQLSTDPTQAAIIISRAREHG